MRGMRRGLWQWSLAICLLFRKNATVKTPGIACKELYKQRNQVERLFRRIKRFRRIFTRYDKLDVIFLAFIYFALVFDALM